MIHNVKVCHSSIYTASFRFRDAHCETMSVFFVMVPEECGNGSGLLTVREPNGLWEVGNNNKVKEDRSHADEGYYAHSLAFYNVPKGRQNCTFARVHLRLINVFKYM